MRGARGAARGCSAHEHRRDPRHADARLASRGSCSGSSPASSCAGRSAPCCSTCRARRSCAGPSSGRRSSAEINDVFPPERLLEDARAGRPDRRLRSGRRRSSLRPTRALAKDPDVVARVEERRARDGHRVRARRRGLRLGRVPRARRDERARRRGHRAAAGRPAGGTRVHVDGRRVRRDERPRRAARARARRPPARARGAGARRRRRARRLPEERAAHADAGATRRHGRRPQPRRVRARAGHDARSRRSAARSSPGAPVARASTRRGACERPCSRGAPRETRRLRDPGRRSCGRRSRRRLAGQSPTDCAS